MNTFNRIVIILVLLILIVMMSAVFVLPHVVLTNVGDWLSSWGRYFDQVRPPALRWIVGILLALVFDAIALFLLYLEVRPRRKRHIRVQQVTGGMATINSDSIAQQLQYKIDPIPGVIDVDPIVNDKGDRVQASVHVEVMPGVNIPRMAGRLMEIVQEVLTEDLGLQVYGEPEVRIKVAKEGEKPKRKREREPEPKPEPDESDVIVVPEEEGEVWAGTNPEEEDVKRA